MHVALNAYFWNRANTGSGQYLRRLVYQLNRQVADLSLTLIFPRAPGDPGPEDVPPSVNVEQVDVRSGSLGKVLFEQRDFPAAPAGRRHDAGPLARRPGGRDLQSEG